MPGLHRIQEAAMLSRWLGTSRAGLSWDAREGQTRELQDVEGEMQLAHVSHTKARLFTLPMIGLNTLHRMQHFANSYQSGESPGSVLEESVCIISTACTRRTRAF